MVAYRTTIYLKLAIKTVLLSLLLVSTTALGVQASADPHPVRVGVLAKRGLDHCMNKWKPTAEHLSKVLPGHQFVIVPLDFASVPKAVAEKRVEFILTNSSSYVELEDQYGVDAIATLINHLHCGDHQLFGGVIFTRKDRTDIATIENLRGRHFMAVKETSLGGWRMAWREMKAQGINPHKDFESLSFGGTHDAVVMAVLNRQVDAGTVRTDTLERMAAEGKIDLSVIRILNLNQGAEKAEHIVSSTRLYPEWPMARLSHISDTLAEDIAQALFQMEAGSKAAKAARSSGWTYPLSYHPVHDLLKDLQLGPYDPHAQISLGALVERYTHWIILVGIAFLAVGLGIVGVFKLNTRLSSMNAELMREVEKRKKIEAGLRESDENLRSALSAANEANKSKAEFLANMSHELRTPMNGIIGMTSILERSNLSEEQTEYINIIMKSAEGLLGIINDILDYSYIEAGQSRLEAMDFDLYALVNGVVKSFAPMAEEKGLVYSQKVEDEVPAFLNGDARRIKKILRMLMSNAVKFTHEGAVSLNVSMARDAENHCTLNMAVQDTGIGISDDRQEQIFNPFTQVDYSSTRQYGGTGLGLALARHFAEMMGGSIEVESAAGEGSTFMFTVDVDKQSSVASSAPESPLNITQIPSPQRVITQQPPPQAKPGGPCVLVVEDNVVNQKVMLRLLGKLDYQAKVVENGRKAVEELQKATYDLVLMDIQMPEMNGYEATSAIRNPQNNCLDPQVPIIAVTANAMREDRNNCLEAGMDDYLSKPLNSNKLSEKLRKWYPKGEGVRGVKSPLPN